ncbi:MAG: hypothetical protein C4K49_03910 [Candidatus Thorarchaeota archaeon]|nr:MAG: hypothetical protein C4K49_03910 [Candidatus Thorarchaeota archaeon]
MTNMPSADNASNSAAETPGAAENEPTRITWRMSVRKLFTNRNFTVFLITNWIFASLQVAGQYFNLYLRDIGIPYIGIGALMSAMLIMVLIATAIAGYLADNYNRRNLAIITMVVNGLGFLLMSFAVNFWTAGLALFVIASSNFTGQGGTAYIYETMDRKHSGVAVSLFTLGTLFGLGPLFVIALMLNSGLTLVEAMRPIFFFGAVVYFVSAGVRVVWLESTKIRERQKSGGMLRDFLHENARGLRMLARVFPVFITVMMLDALSDSFYSFSNLFYVNETLAFGFGEINLMLLITLAVSIPITLYLGQVFDRHGGRRITVAVYSVMPFALSLLILARVVQYVAPATWVNYLHSLYPGLEVVFSLAFIAVATKATNDVLWGSVISTYVQKSLPRQELGKMLGLTTLLILVTGIFGPFISGYIYQTFLDATPLLVMAIVLNVMILIVLVTKSIEPRVKVEELEQETTTGPKLQPDATANK